MVASQSAMLALSTADQGDVCVRTDLSKSFILLQAPPSTLANWQELLTPGDAVISVNNKTGAVTLTTSDITEGTRLYYTDARVKAHGDTLYAPISHATNLTTYGVATNVNYGHARSSTSLPLMAAGTASAGTHSGIYAPYNPWHPREARMAGPAPTGSTAEARVRGPPKAINGFQGSGPEHQRSKLQPRQ